MIIEAKLLSMLHVDKKLIWWIHFFQKLKLDSNQTIWFITIIFKRFVFLFQKSQNRDKISTRRHRTMLIKTVSTKRLFFNELSIYRKNDNERIDKDFIIIKTLRIHQLIEIRRCRIFDQNNWMRLNKILLTLMTNEIWLNSCNESIKVLSRKEFYFWSINNLN